MQLILVSNRLGQAKSLVLSPRQLAFGAVGAALIALFAATAITLFALHGLARSDGTAVRDLLASSLAGQSGSPASPLGAKLDSVAKRIGHLQAETTVLALEGESLAASAGIKASQFRLESRPAEGGPAPLDTSGWLSMDDIERVLDGLTAQIRNHADYLDVLKSRVLDRAARGRLLPTMLPIPNARLGSGFGVRTDPFTGALAMHEGLDLEAEVGTPIMAAGGGIVIFAGFQSDFGNVIEIDHGNGIVTRYAHCSRLDVKAGDLVARGQIIGAVGDTGRATGPHLHFEIRYHNVAQNPIRFIQSDLQRVAKLAHPRAVTPN